MANILRNRLRCAVVAIALCSGLSMAADGQDLLNDTTAEGVVARYQDFSKYPPESRPLHASNWDLLNPWTVDTAKLPLTPASWKAQLETLMASGMSQADIAQKIGAPSSFPTYNFAVNKLILAGTQDALLARLTVSPAPGTVSLPSFRIAKAQLIGDSNFGSQNLGAVPFSCEPGVDPVCTFTWKALTGDKRYWGTLQLQVTVAVAGKGDDYVALLHFYSSPMVAGKFTGNFQERLEAGSLLIDASVSVQKRMACFVSANLYSVDKGVPTHHAERRMIVDPSMNAITFTFFGKIFRDNGHEGAFRLQDLKAQCENLPYPPEWFMDSSAHLDDLAKLKTPASEEPSRVYFEYNSFTFTTKSHLGSEFSADEWQAPERAQKLELLKKAAQKPEDPSMPEQLKRLAK